MIKEKIRFRFNIKEPLMGHLRFDTQGTSQVYKCRFRKKTGRKQVAMQKDGLKIEMLLNCTYNSWSFMFTHFRLLL